MEITSFGAWLRRRRRALDLTQEDLAQRVGCAPGTIRKIEADERRPSKQLAELLAEQLAIPPTQRVVFLQAARAELAVDRLAAPTRPTDQTAVTLASPARPTGTVTFLFTDIEGSTKLWEQHPQAMPQALASHDTILRAAIEAHGGVVFRTVGNAFCAAFADATAALLAALAAQRALQSAAWGAQGPLRVRMALHTGVVAVAGDDYQGLALNRIARLVAAGHSGQILLSRATHELVREELPLEVTLRDLGEHRLRDLTHPEQIYQLIVPDLPSDFPPLRTLERHRTNLPAQPTALIGRAAEVRTVVEQLRRSDVRLLTLTGPGGTGKTRLALQAVAELLEVFADGVWFVDLAPLLAPALVVSAIAQTLELKETGGQPLLETLKAYLHTKRMLLVLDNFEHLLDAAPVVAELLAAAPQLKVLITSRAVLHLSGEREFGVSPLSLPDPAHMLPLERLTQYDAVRLFIERAQAVKHDFAVTNANAPAVAEICYRLDGLPLAIELAAARISLFAPEALLKRLERRLLLLTGGPRDLPARQQTLRSTIDWSYQLLPPETQALFRQLAVFVGGCTLEAAEAICDLRLGAETEQIANRQSEIVTILDGLAALVDQSLLRQVEGPDGEPRFVMLETIREYALDRLHASGEVEAVRRQHAQCFLRLVEAREWPVEVWLEHLETDHDNLRTALGWAVAGGHAELAAHLAVGLVGFWSYQGYLSEGRQWLEAALEQSSALPVDVQAGVLFGAGDLGWLQGDNARATTLYEASLALFREQDNQRGVASALFALGTVAYFQCAYAQAAAQVEASLALFREQDNQRGIAAALFRLGAVAQDQEDYPRATALIEESLARFRELGDKVGIADTAHILGINARLQGDDARALTLEQESLALCRELGFKRLIPSVLIGLGYLAQHHGAAARARSCFAEGLALCREQGDRRVFPLCLAGLAGVAGMVGQPERAARLFGAAEALAEAFHQPRLTGHGIEIERNVAIARAQLSEASIAAAWAEGRAMSLEQAIAYALSEDDGGSELPQTGHTAKAT